ncbi:MAG TPA: hypothetical protein DCW60_04020, partial [Sutterella sp.]|nr:hypothetical protein [Sutterella sp.]
TRRIAARKAFGPLKEASEVDRERGFVGKLKTLINHMDNESFERFFCYCFEYYRQIFDSTLETKGIEFVSKIGI